MANTRPSGQIRPSTLFYPAQHLVSTWRQHLVSLPLVKEQLHLYSPKITFSLLKATLRLMLPLVKMSLTPLSRASWEMLWCRSISGAACCQPWDTCLELQSDPQFVAASAGPGCMGEGPSCAPRPAFSSTETGGTSAKIPRYPEICLHLMACC